MPQLGRSTTERLCRLQGSHGGINLPNEGVLHTGKEGLYGQCGQCGQYK